MRQEMLDWTTINQKCGVNLASHEPNDKLPKRRRKSKAADEYR